MQYIDKFLDQITMYKLVLYYLIFLLYVALNLSILQILPFNTGLFLVSIVFLVVVCWVSNKIFSLVFKAPTNVESVYISALILALILSPAQTVADIPLLFWAAVLTMASKYILAVRNKHIFNPVAVAVTLTAFGFDGGASWWIGTASMAPFCLLGFLIVRKIKRYDLVLYFFLSSLAVMLGATALRGGDLIAAAEHIILLSPIFFFAFVMLTEPLTTPPTKKLQAAYGAIVGIFFAPQLHYGFFFTSPEIALVIGNVFSYLVSPKYKIVLKLLQKLNIATEMKDFVFFPEKELSFSPGQYMEWTLPHKNPDSRGNRRYFTIASSPTEGAIRLGVKFYSHGSSFKRALSELTESVPIVGAQLSGDFTLPKNKEKKLAFIAGGIGVTPFRSMIKYLIDKKEQRSIILFFSNKTADEIVYTDVFNQAQSDLGIKTVYALTDKEKIPAGWTGKVGRVDAEMIKAEAPDFMERMFYLSGPHAMVSGYKKTLQQMGVPKKHIKTDFFPGFA